MIDVKTFYSLPNWLDLEGRTLPVIVTSRKLACWYCGQTDHLSAIFPGKKSLLKTPNRSLPRATAKGKLAVRTLVSVPVGYKPVPPLTSEAAPDNPKKSKREWLTVGRGGRRFNPAGFQSKKVSQVDTNSSESPHINATKTTSVKAASKTNTFSKSTSKSTKLSTPLNLKFHLRFILQLKHTSSPSRTRCFSPGRDKFEEHLEF